MTGRAIEFMAAGATIPSCYLHHHAPLALYRARAITICTATTRFCRRYGRTRSATTRIPCSKRIWHPENLNFSMDDVRDNVMPAYMGLIKQIDDQMGACFRGWKTRGGWTTR